MPKPLALHGQERIGARDRGKWGISKKSPVKPLINIMFSWKISGKSSSLLKELQWDSTAMELSRRRIGPEAVGTCQQRSKPAGQLWHWEHCYFDKNLKHLSEYFHTFHSSVIFSDTLLVYPLLELRYQNKVSSLSCNAKHREKKLLISALDDVWYLSQWACLSHSVFLTKMTDGTKPNNTPKCSAHVVTLFTEYSNHHSKTIRLLLLYYLLPSP